MNPEAAGHHGGVGGGGVGGGWGGGVERRTARARALFPSTTFRVGWTISGVRPATRGTAAERALKTQGNTTQGG